MSLFEWKDEYSVKIASLDEQHKKLVSILNELHSSMLHARSIDLPGKILSQLVTYAKEHFDLEEKLMAQYQFSGLEDHQKIHRIFETKVQDFMNDYETGKKMVSVEILFFLKDWLFNHINGTDKEYSLYLNSRGVH